MHVPFLSLKHMEEVLMAKKPTYEELERRVTESEGKSGQAHAA
jgi:hypothetical protein